MINYIRCLNLIWSLSLKSNNVAIMITGNKDLCGKPLESLCPDPNSEENTSPVQPPITSTIDSHPKKGASIPGIIIIVIAGIVAAAAVLILLAICGRSRKEAPQLGRVVSSSTSLNEQNLHSTKSLRQVGPTDVSDYKTLTPDVNNSSKKSESSKLSFVREDRQQFDLQDLLRASAEVLGSGNFGSSYKAVLMDGQAVVVKRFKQMNNVGREEFHEHMRRLGRLVHPNLLPLVAYYYRKEEKLLVFDYVQNGSLASHLHGIQFYIIDTTISSFTSSYFPCMVNALCISSSSYNLLTSYDMLTCIQYFQHTYIVHISPCFVFVYIERVMGCEFNMIRTNF